MKYCIYGLFDPYTHELRYIGRSSSGLNRPHQHWGDAFKKKKDGSWRFNYYVYRWLRTLNPNTPPAIGVIQEFDITPKPNQCLNEAEKYWIRHFRTAGCRLTNLTDGGEGSIGWTPSNETRCKISTALTGRKIGPFTKTHRDRLSEAGRHRVLSEEAHKNMSEAQRGKQITESHKQKISQSLKGRCVHPPFSESTLAKMRAAKLGKPLSEEHKQRIGEATRGRTVQAEAKAKIRKAKLGKKRAPFTQEWRHNLGNSHKKSVVCLDDGLRFDSALDAAKNYKISASGIARNAKGKIPHVSHLKFAYYDKE
jgi:hypothetical protein